MRKSVEGAKPKVAMVEDEWDFRESAIDYLRASGYEAWGVGSGEEFYKQLLTDSVDIVVLDIGLPGESGFEIAKHLSASQRGIGIVILSARNQVADRLTGLGNGADCYLVKPVDLQELIANIEAVWRRIQGTTTVGTVAVEPAKPAALSGEWALDQERWILISPENVPIELTSKEFAFIRCLLNEPGEMVGKAALASVLSSNAQDYDYHRMDVMLSRLRKKGQALIGGPLPIKTVQSYGYAFTARCQLR